MSNISNYIDHISADFDPTLGFEFFSKIQSAGDIADTDEIHSKLLANSKTYDKLSELPVTNLFDYRLVPETNRNLVMIANLFIVEKNKTPDIVESRRYFKSYASSIINFDQKVKQLMQLMKPYFIVNPIKFYDSEKMPFKSVYDLNSYANYCVSEYYTPKLYYLLRPDQYVYISYTYTYSVGCQHYICGAELQCNTCQGFFSCRLCHENPLDYKFIANETKIEKNDTPEEIFHKTVIPQENQIFTPEERKKIRFIDYTKTIFKDRTDEECKKHLDELKKKMTEANDLPVNVYPKDEDKEEESNEESDGFGSFLEEENHVFPKYETKNVRCCFCRTVQPYSRQCVNCGVVFASYNCDICKLYSGLPRDSKPNFHCEKCNVCLVGYKEITTHCDKCNACYSSLNIHDHMCVKDEDASECVVCGGQLKNSIYGCSILICNPRHKVHSHCYNSLITRGNNKCPICRKLIITGDDLDYFNIRMHIMWAKPITTFSFARQARSLLCNQCDNKFYDIRNLYEVYRCTKIGCRSYNISTMDVFPLTNEIIKTISEQNRILKENNEEIVDPKETKVLMFYPTDSEVIKILRKVNKASYRELYKTDVAILFMANEGKINPTKAEITKYIKENEKNEKFKETLKIKVNEHIKDAKIRRIKEDNEESLSNEYDSDTDEDF